MLAASLLTALCWTATAHAAFPGKNGKIAYEAFFDGIFTINPDGSGRTQLSTFGWAPAWSPDGRRITFYSFGRAYVMNDDGSGLISLGRGLWPSWSPDGRRIVFSADSRETVPGRNIWVMNDDGSGRNRLTDGHDVDPAWSPDGSRIAFTRETPDPGIYVMDSDGSNVTKLISGVSAGWPNWSPDGNWIVFNRTRGQVWKMTATGGSLTRLTTFGEGDAAWSPDGTKIVYGTGQELFVINANGSAPTNITNTPSYYDDEGNPDWQPIPAPKRGDYKNASKFCKAERAFLGDEAFRQKYGGKRNAHGKCVSSNN